ncbi:cytochrome b/b6 domain-containing protein [Cryobacterium sp. 10I1]|uniref:cytochrome b n=1 Tax=unclassified Cryobacterium TaxID=2649013 RepID=UPI002AC8AD79|nr:MULTISPECIES: cytochrome b/b6 domain-containing protein [unclassified Cryobacterium]MEB0286725.1 cytochrome b/b6 domain-containing protein [Cryobacterium sp. 10S3]MEB0304432.1 cytochrome b/b6 domain-containing protein [Cryobacterium sp. 10I1]WPX13156.1 cytochrome b/b6 domain-containing protein [Cryobacterium sp. 10S3]
MKSTATRYGTIAASFHWVSAVVILTMLVTGVLSAGLVKGETRSGLLRVHVVLGITLLAITIARVIWGLVVDRRPAAFAGQRRRERVAELSLRVLLYLALFAAFASGIATLLISGTALPLLGGVTVALPDFESVPGFPIHGLAAGLLLLLSLGHIGAALWHQLVRKERVLARIGIGRSAR